MATVTKSIGTTARDYSTITLWEADLDNVAVYSASDDAVGECYNDSVFDENTTINGGGTVGLSSRTLTVASGDRHDGTAGTGARIVKTTNGAPFTVSVAATDILWIEIDKNGKDNALVNSTPNDVSVRNIIGHGGVGANFAVLLSSGNDSDVEYIGNILYDFQANGTNKSVTAIALATGSAGRVKQALNNTIMNMSATGTGNATGIDASNDADATAKNNLIGGFSSPSGTATDYLETGANPDEDFNGTEDGTATGANSITIVVNDQFESTVGGSEDYHLKAVWSWLNAGIDLGTSPPGVEIDIDGRDRDAEGDTWDMGADELVAPVVGGNLRHPIRAFQANLMR